MAGTHKLALLACLLAEVGAAVTRDDAREIYRLHADDERNVDALTLGIWLAVGLLGWLLVYGLWLAIRAALAAFTGG